jgi:hypothetical protein
MIITRFTVQKDSGGYLDPSSFHDETMAHAITPNDRTDVEALLSALRPLRTCVSAPPRSEQWRHFSRSPLMKVGLSTIMRAL